MPASPRGHSASRTARRVLLFALGLETILAVIALVPLFTGFTGSGDELLGQRVSVLFGGVIAAAWVVITFLGALRIQGGWPRGSALTIHVLLFAAGTGMLQYALAPFWMSAGVILLALIGFFAALLAKPEIDVESEAESAP